MNRRITMVDSYTAKVHYTPNRIERFLGIKSRTYNYVERSFITFVYGSGCPWVCKETGEELENDSSLRHAIMRAKNIFKYKDD